MLIWYFIPWLFLKNYLPWCKYYLELSLLPQLRDDLPKYGNPKLISVSFSSCNYIVSHSVRFLGSDSNIIEVIILIIRWEIQSLSHGKSAFCLSSLFFFFQCPHYFTYEWGIFVFQNVFQQCRFPMMEFLVLAYIAAKIILALNCVLASDNGNKLINRKCYSCLALH